MAQEGQACFEDLPPAIICLIGDTLGPELRTDLRELSKGIRASVMLSGAVVYVHADEQGALFDLPDCEELPVQPGGHKLLRFDLRGLRACDDIDLASDNLMDHLTGSTDFIQGFRSIDMIGPRWALEMVLSVISAVGALREVTSLTLVGKDEDHRPFSDTLGLCIRSASNLTSLILDGMETDLTQLSELCNSSKLNQLTSVTALCSEWQGSVALQHVVQLNLLCDTKSDKMLGAASCFPPDCLSVLKHLTITHIDPYDMKSDDHRAVNGLLIHVIPLIPNLEGVFLGKIRGCGLGHVAIMDRETLKMLSAVHGLKLLRVGGFESGHTYGQRPTLTALEELHVDRLRCADLAWLAPGIHVLRCQMVLADSDADTDQIGMAWFPFSPLKIALPSIITSLSLHEENLKASTSPLPAVTHLCVQLTGHDDVVSIDMSGILNIQSLTLKVGNNCSTEPLVGFLLTLHQHLHLRHLCLVGFVCDAEGLDAIYLLPHLEHLQLIDTSITEEQVYDCIVAMPHLRDFTIVDTTHDEFTVTAGECRAVQRSDEYTLNLRLHCLNRERTPFQMWKQYAPVL